MFITMTVDDERASPTSSSSRRSSRPGTSRSRTSRARRETPILERFYKRAQRAARRRGRQAARQDREDPQPRGADGDARPRCPASSAVAPMVNGNAIATYGTKTINLTIFGVEPERQLRVTTIGDERRSRATSPACRPTADGIILGRGVADVLGAERRRQRHRSPARPAAAPPPASSASSRPASRRSITRRGVHAASTARRRCSTRRTSSTRSRSAPTTTRKAEPLRRRRSRASPATDRELAGGQRQLPEDLQDPDDHHLHHHRARCWSSPRSAC